MIPRVPGTRAEYRRKPRASGDDPAVPFIGVKCGGVNPARAGMIPNPPPPWTYHISKPRASGDDPRRRVAGSCDKA